MCEGMQYVHLGLSTDEEALFISQPKKPSEMSVQKNIAAVNINIIGAGRVAWFKSGCNALSRIWKEATKDGLLRWAWCWYVRLCRRSKPLRR